MSAIIEQKLKLLANIYTNLKKSINNRIRSVTLNDKNEKAEELCKLIRFLIIEHTSELTDVQVDYFTQLTQNTFNAIQKIITRKLEDSRTPIRLKSLARLIILLKRFDMALDIKTASELSSLIPSFDGTPTNKKSFVDAISLGETIVPQVQRVATIQIVLTKLTGKARDLFTDTPTTYQEIKDKISRNCAEKPVRTYYCRI